MGEIKFPIIFAHRGANQLAPENTLAAFQLAHDLGAQAFEFDVQLSKDLVPVVIHDETLERTTDGAGFVADKTFTQLKKLDAGSWFANEYSHETIPSFAEVLKRLIPWGAYLNVELKENQIGAKALVDQTLEVLRQLHCPKDQVFLSSFSEEMMRLLVQKKQEYPLAWLVDEVNPKAYTFAKDWRCMSIHPNVEILQLPNSTFIKEMKENGLKIFSYTVNDPETAKALVAQGLDGFFTDNEMLYHWSVQDKE